VTYVITPAAPEHLGALPAIELSAATRFRSWSVPPCLFTDTTAMETLRVAQADGLLWVALTPAGQPVGFALASASGARLYLEELDVSAEHGGQGLGLALLAAVERRAATAGFVEIALTTYRDVPWNAPFYLRHGFEPADGCDTGLNARLLKEASRGLDSLPRVALRKRVDRPASTSSGSA